MSRRARRSRRVGDVGEQFLEGTEADAFADVGGYVVEQLVEGLLGVAVGALVVRVVRAPQHVLPPHGHVGLDGGAVVLTGILLAQTAR